MRSISCSARSAPPSPRWSIANWSWPTRAMATSATPGCAPARRAPAPTGCSDGKAKDAVVIEAFPGYAGGAAPRIRRVIVRHVAEAAAQRLLLDKGDVDV